MSMKDIKQRISQGKQAFNQMKNLLFSKMSFGEKKENEKILTTDLERYQTSPRTDNLFMIIKTKKRSPT